MSKGKILSLVTVSGMLLMSGGSLVQADVLTGGSDIMMVSGVDTGVTDPTTPPPSSTDPSTPAPNTDPSTPTPSTDPITDPTDPSTPTPSTDPITDTTDPSTPTPSTDPSTPTPSTDSSTPTPSTDPSTPPSSTDSSTPTPGTDSSTPTPGTDSSTPASKPITKPNIDSPISTVTGDVVVGTDNGKIIVKEGNDTVLKDAKEVGGEVQKDGTVAIKKSDGGLEVLPHTGESKTIFTIVGVLLIAGAIWISIKDNNKKFLNFLKKKKEKYIDAMIDFMAFLIK